MLRILTIIDRIRVVTVLKVVVISNEERDPLPRHDQEMSPIVDMTRGQQDGRRQNRTREKSRTRGTPCRHDRKNDRN